MQNKKKAIEHWLTSLKGQTFSEEYSFEDWARETIPALVENIYKEAEWRKNDISAWINYGKKRGYFDFIELEKEALPKLYSGSRIYNILLQVQDGSISCGRAIELMREIIK
jgi:hypothetical protein